MNSLSVVTPSRKHSDKIPIFEFYLNFNDQKTFNNSFFGANKIRSRYQNSVGCFRGEDLALSTPPPTDDRPSSIQIDDDIDDLISISNSDPRAETFAWPQGTHKRILAAAVSSSFVPSP